MALTLDNTKTMKQFTDKLEKKMNLSYPAPKRPLETPVFNKLKRAPHKVRFGAGRPQQRISGQKLLFLLTPNLRKA